MRRKGFIKGTAMLMAFSLCLSGVGCGKKTENYVVDDYYLETETSGSENRGDDLAETDDSGEYSESFNFNWKNSFSAGDKNVTAAINYKDTFLKDKIKIYNVSNVQKFGEDEKTIAASLLGDSYTKLDGVSCTDGTAYLALVNRYRMLMETFAEYDKASFTDAQTNDTFFALSTVANYNSPSRILSDKYSWVDNDKYAIHMYEGNYGSDRFCLLLAYDNVKKTRYIYFHPVDIKRYYPDKDYKTLILENSEDIYGNKVKDENECDLSEVDAEREISDFLTGKLHLNETEVELGKDFKVYNMTADPFLGSLNSLTLDGQHNADGMPRLVFFDSDYYNSVIGYAPDFEIPDGISSVQFTTTRSVEILSVQDDPLEGKVTDDVSFANYMSGSYALGGDTDIENVSYTTDGYAMYINPAFQSYYETNSGIRTFDDDSFVNSGMIGVTSKGIFCADIIQMLNVETAEETELMEASEIIDAAVKALESESYPKDMAESKQLSIRDMDFSYCLIDSCKYVPVWRFEVKAEDTGLTAELQINAVTGEFIDFVPTYSY